MRECFYNLTIVLGLLVAYGCSMPKESHHREAEKTLAEVQKVVAHHRATIEHLISPYKIACELYTQDDLAFISVFGRRPQGYSGYILNPIHEPPLTIDTTTFYGFLETLSLDQRNKSYRELEGIRNILKQKGFHVGSSNRASIIVWLRLPKGANQAAQTIGAPGKE